MAGIAVGNLLGIRLEGWSKRQVARSFPNGIREITARPGYPDDDDLAQAVVIAEAAEAGPLDPGDLARRLWVWAETNGAGMGGLTGDVLALYGGEYPQRLARNRREGAPRRPTGVPIYAADPGEGLARDAGLSGTKNDSICPSPTFVLSGAWE